MERSPNSDELHNRWRVQDTTVISRVDAREVNLSHRDTLGPCSVDLFATRLNNQLRRCVSWRPDPFAIATDAFTMSWQEEVGYAFPPFSLIGRCLQKVRLEGCTVVLVTPVWDVQPWYPVLLDLLIEYPLLLLSHSRPLQQGTPIGDQPQLAAWKLSGRPTLQKELQNGLQRSSG